MAICLNKTRKILNTHTHTHTHTHTAACGMLSISLTRGCKYVV